jgi:DNA-binding MarR family transcriptional regulator
MRSEKTATESQSRLPTLPCACANLRRAARAVTRLYNQELRAKQIEITQFTLLMALERTGEISQGELGKLLALDSTTLTRMLELLKKRAWIQEKEGDDRRFRLIRLTTAGRTKFQQSLPNWKRAQDRVESALGEDTMRDLEGVLTKVTGMTARS